MRRFRKRKKKRKRRIMRGKMKERRSELKN